MDKTKTIDLPKMARGMIGAAALNDQAGTKLIDRAVGAIQLAAEMAMSDFDVSKDRVELIITQAQVRVTRTIEEEDGKRKPSDPDLAVVEPNGKPKEAARHGAHLD